MQIDNDIRANRVIRQLSGAEVELCPSCKQMVKQLELLMNLMMTQFKCKCGEEKNASGR